MRTFVCVCASGLPNETSTWLCAAKCITCEQGDTVQRPRAVGRTRAKKATSKGLSLPETHCYDSPVQLLPTLISRSGNVKRLQSGNGSRSTFERGSHGVYAVRFHQMGDEVKIANIAAAVVVVGLPAHYNSEIWQGYSWRGMVTHASETCFCAPGNG
jgi:hypothetical protein